MEKIIKTFYKAYDGTEFDNAIDCKEYEVDKEMHIYDLLKEVKDFCITARTCSRCPFSHENERKTECHIIEKLSSTVSPNLWNLN